MDGKLQAIPAAWISAPVSSTLSHLKNRRHTRREAGIQCHGWQALIRPWRLDSGNPCRNDEYIWESDKVELERVRKSLPK